MCAHIYAMMRGNSPISTSLITPHLAKRLGEGTIPAAPPNDYTTSSLLRSAMSLRS